MSHLIPNFAPAPIVPLDDEGALNWLRSQPAGRVTATAAELGRRWGWHRQRVGRRLTAWAKSGLVTLHGDIVTLAEPALLMPVTSVSRRPRLDRSAPSAVWSIRPAKWWRPG
jgi:hypothetical protein